MLIFKTKVDLQKYLSDNPAKVGFVPTMGALHAGHLSLITKSKMECETTICSIFVNPTQFDNPDDFALYPITIESDIELLNDIDCNILYLPSLEDIYPEKPIILKDYNLGKCATVLEGAYRKGHFQGVANVVYRLLDAVKPNKLYLGAKDFQQVMIIKEMMKIEKMAIEIESCPIFRETDGLAMSSRNCRLTDVERKQALAIYNSLIFCKNNFQIDTFGKTKEIMSKMILDNGFSSIDYIELAEANTLELLSNFDTSKKMVVIVACFLGKVRLIDNMEINII